MRKSKSLINCFKVLTLGFMVFVLIVSGQAVFAAEDDKDEKKDDTQQGFLLEEVVVTAQKRPENLQDVPISITAISEVRLEQLGAKDISDMEHFAPNVDIGNSMTNQNPSMRIRGITTSAVNAGYEAGFGLYIDGVYMGRNSAVIQSNPGSEMLKWK